MKNPLLRMLWWESVAPLGNPVVPDVYWMLMGSSNWSSASRAARSSALTRSASRSSACQPSSSTSASRSSGHRPLTSPSIAT